jgi:hypothetical protein
MDPSPPPTSTGGGIDSSDSGLMTLSPAFLEALRKVVPTRRRAKLPYIVGLGLLAVAGVVGTDRSTREFIAERWLRAPVAAAGAAVLPQGPEPATAHGTVPPAASSDPPVENPVVPAASAIENTSGTAATAKKKRPRRPPPQPKEKRTTSGI